MLAKSKRSAVIMGSIAVLSVIIVTATSSMIRYFLLGRVATEDSAISNITGSIVLDTIIGLMGLLLVVALQIGLASFLIYQLDACHFGQQGAIRWAIVGAIYALVWQVGLPLLPRSNLLIVNRIVEDCKQLLVVGLSYLIVFRLFRTRTKCG